jgi:hypothetical protein
MADGSPAPLFLPRALAQRLPFSLSFPLPFSLPFNLPRPLSLLHLKLLQAEPQKPRPLPAAFRVHAWHWHHLAVERDLSRLSFALGPADDTPRSRDTPLCAGTPVAARRRSHVARALRFVFSANWDVHDLVEADLFVPFASPFLRPSERRDFLPILRDRRRTLAADRTRLLARVETWAAAECVPTTSCERERTAIARDVLRVRRDAASLFADAEAVLGSAVGAGVDKGGATEREQADFNSVVIKALDGGKARTALVIFDDALPRNGEQHDRAGVESRATARDRREFELSIPAPVRMLIPVWRRTLIGRQLRAFEGY